MKVLVTGGAGFIGSNFIHYQLENYDDQIINLDKLSYAGNLDNLRSVEKNSNYQFRKIDICNKEKVAEIMQQQKVDYIVNFAAESHVDRSIVDPSDFIKTNIEGTHNLLDLALKFNVKKFVQISTDEVYGSLKQGKFAEKSPLKPTNPYSASKAAADHLVQAYAKTYGLNTNITRSSNNFGPYQYPEKLIPLFIIKTFKNKKLPLYGDGTNIRDWIYVKDHCRAVDMVMRKAKKGKIYNIGADQQKSNLEITKNILSIFSQSELLIKYVEDRKGHDYRYAVDSSKIKNELNWKPKVGFEKALLFTINWYLDHKNWWQKLI